MRPTSILITVGWLGMLFVAIVLIGPGETVIENLFSATAGLVLAIGTVFFLDRLNK